jgi:outer membrane protein OmpA-like peptidoglycan-associated protein
MRKSFLAGLGAAALSVPLFWSAAVYSQTKADYTKEQIISSFTRTASAPKPAATQACDPRQVVKDEDGNWVHVKCSADTAGLSLPAGVLASSMVTQAVVHGSGWKWNMLLMFDTDSAVLNEHDKADAQAFAQALIDGRMKDHRFRIEGYTDEIGGQSARNMVLSQQRADAVKAYLVELGVEPDRLEAKGFGPVLLRRNLKAARINRRVVARVMD